MRGRYRAIYKDGQLFAEYEGDELTFLRADYVPPQRSDFAAPSIISDHTAPFRSMADGRLYDSKSAYRADLNRRGLVELGNDAPLTVTPTAPDSTSRRELITRQLADVSDKDANKVLKQLKKVHAP